MALCSGGLPLPIQFIRICKCVRFPILMSACLTKLQLWHLPVLLPNRIAKNKSASDLTWVTTLQIFLLFFVGPVAGVLMDALGPRRVLPAFSILLVLALCMLSLCTEYWQIMLAQGVAFGIGAAGVSLPALTVVAQWFSTKRGLVVGMVSSGSSLGL